MRKHRKSQRNTKGKQCFANRGWRRGAGVWGNAGPSFARDRPASALPMRWVDLLRRITSEIAPVKRTVRSALLYISAVIALSACATTNNSASQLIATGATSGDALGYSVAISGNTALVGAFREETVMGEDAGAAYVYTLQEGKWQREARLTAPDGATGDTFGGNVAVHGDTALVGVMRDSDAGAGSGSVHVFVRKGGQWTHQAKLVASDAKAGASFGQNVALFGETAVIGAPRDEINGVQQGSAYVFTRREEAWSEQAKLAASDGATGDVFGISVAVFGNTALVGADLHDEIAEDAGAAYVFVREGENWRQQAKLVAADGDKVDIFGVRVALSGNTALISARRDDDDHLGVDSGSAYVFVRAEGRWREQAKLTAPDGAANDRFGNDVAISGDVAVLSAMLHDGQAEDAGAAYVFTRTGEKWEFQAKHLAADGLDGDALGGSVALSGNSAIIGASRADHGGEDAGAAYAFNLGALP